MKGVVAVLIFGACLSAGICSGQTGGAIRRRIGCG
jgi:hypothetical protein